MLSLNECLSSLKGARIFLYQHVLRCLLYLDAHFFVRNRTRCDCVERQGVSVAQGHFWQTTFSLSVAQRPIPPSRGLSYSADSSTTLAPEKAQKSSEGCREYRWNEMAWKSRPMVRLLFFFAFPQCSWTILCLLGSYYSWAVYIRGNFWPGSRKAYLENLSWGTQEPRQAILALRGLCFTIAARNLVIHI